MFDLFLTSRIATRGSGLLEDFLAKWRVRQAKALIHERLQAGRILDIGCGQRPYFLIKISFSEKYGLDPALESDGVSGINLQKLDVEKCRRLPYADDFFDVVTMLAVVEHISPDRLVNLLAETRRVIKADGRLIVTTPAPWVSPVLFVMGVCGLVSKEELKEHQPLYSVGGMREYFERAGFSSDKINSGYFEVGMNQWVCGDV